MTVVYSDAFPGALSGVNYSDESGTWSASGGVAACSSNSFRVMNTTLAAHAALADVLVTVKRASATFDGCVIARSNVSGATSSAGDCYFMNAFDVNTLQFYRRIAGVNSQVGSNVPATFANGDTFGLKVTGSGATVTLTAYVNAIQVGTAADISGPRIVVAGQTGLVGFNLNSRYDDFSVDDLIVAGTPMPPEIQNRRIYILP